MQRAGMRAVRAGWHGHRSEVMRARKVDRPGAAAPRTLALSAAADQARSGCGCGGYRRHVAPAACTEGCVSSTGAGGHTAVADYRMRAKRVFDSPHQFVGRQEPRRPIGQLCCSIALRGTQCASEGQIMIDLTTGSARPTSARWRQQQNKQQRIQSRPESARAKILHD